MYKVEMPCTRLQCHVQGGTAMYKVAVLDGCSTLAVTTYLRLHVQPCHSNVIDKIAVTYSGLQQGCNRYI